MKLYNSFFRSELPLCPSEPRTSRLRAQDFVAGNKQQLILLKNMGIQLVTMNDGRIQLLHTATEVLSRNPFLPGDP